jgi:hypothetical protein
VSAAAWATFEVVTGGFATGAVLAGGALQPHEQELLRTLPAIAAGAERAAITSYYLSDAGLDNLHQMLASGRYRIQVPEEGALLVVAWLLSHGHADKARALLDALAPFIGMVIEQEQVLTTHNLAVLFQELRAITPRRCRRQSVRPCIGIGRIQHMISRRRLHRRHLIGRLEGAE